MTFEDLDVRTIFFFLFIGNMIATAFFTAYTLGTKEKSDIFDKLFFTGKLSQGIAWLFLLSYDTTPLGIPTGISLALGNFLLVSGQSEECFALVSLTKIPLKTRIWGFGSLTLVASVLCLSLITPFDVEERLALISMFPAAIFIITGWAFLSQPKRVSWLTKLMGMLCSLSAMGLLIRSLGLIEIFSYSPFISQSSAQIMAIIFLSMVMFTGNFGYILIKKADLNNKILYLATHDPLTGALNKTAFREEFIRLYSMGKKENATLSLIMADLDHFKEVNDRWGHLKGDNVLKEVVAIIMSYLGPYDVLGRYGGDELTILLPLMDVTEAEKVAEQIRKEIEKSFSHSEKCSDCTISIGVAGCNPSEKDVTFEDLLSLSDRALYEAKKKGRNKVVIFNQKAEKL